MLKTWSLFFDKQKKDTSTNDSLQRSKAIADITRLINSHTTNPEDIIEFEVRPDRVASVLSVIDQPPLSERYMIVQSPDVLTLFQAKTIQVEV